MGLDLAAIGEFGQGFTQGAGQGMDLVGKYNQLQEQADKRRKQQEVEAIGMQIAQEGLFQKDPDKALGLMTDAYAKVGDLENAQKFYQQRVTNKEAARKKTAGEAFERIQFGDIEGAVSLINQLDPNVQRSYSTGADGKAMVTGTAYGKQFATPYDDPNQFKAELGQAISNVLVGPAGAIEAAQKERELAAEEKTAESTSRYNLGRLALEEQLAPLRAETEIQQAKSAQASAAANYAQAGAIRAEAPGKARLQEAQIAEAEYANRSALGNDYAAYIKDNMPDLGEDPEDLSTDPMALGRVAMALGDGSGADIPSSTARAKEILRQRITGVDVAAGVVQIGTKEIPVGQEAAAIIKDYTEPAGS